MPDERTIEQQATESMMREYLASCALALELLLATRPCSRCGSLDPADGRGFFLPKVFHRVHSLGAIARCFSRAAVDRLIARQGVLVMCGPCWVKLQSNGSWQAILDARKEQTNAG